MFKQFLQPIIVKEALELVEKARKECADRPDWNLANTVRIAADVKRQHHDKGAEPRSLTYGEFTEAGIVQILELIPQSQRQTLLGKPVSIIDIGSGQCMVYSLLARMGVIASDVRVWVGHG